MPIDHRQLRNEMKFFQRKSPEDLSLSTDTRTAKTEKQHSEHHEFVRAYPSSLNVRPTFGVWLKEIWVDLITMILIAGVAIGFYICPPLSHRYFPIYDPHTGEVMDHSIAYPYIKPVFSSLAAGLICALAPVAVILLMQILRIRSFWDTNNALVGLVYSLLTSTAFQVIVKTVIGGLRPHFLSVCKPSISPGAAQNGLGFEGITYDRSICTGDTRRINNALISFPSGHTNIAFAGFVYLSIYLNAKLKVFSDHQPAYWMLILTYIPILGATLLAGTLIMGAHHHWYDVMGGAVIGTVMALSSYRVMYAAVWDYRVNHIPLSRSVPYRYFYGADRAFEGFGDVVFTRSAGWGMVPGEEVVVRGAPGDMVSWGKSQGAGVVTDGNGYQRRYGMQGGRGKETGLGGVGGKKGDDIV
ncbi:MAG: hypothetical protein M1839_002249 [Geoglossum umbratile]|nr:MAG: hypothetical protein M1839_002249 [Geoglossum umbratile]